MAVIVISLRTPRSTGAKFGCTREHLGAPVTSLGTPTTTLGAPTTILGEPTTCLGAPGSTSDHCKAVWENDIFFENVVGGPGNHSYYLSFNDF